MNAYGSQPEMGQQNSRDKGRFGSPSLQIQREWTKSSFEKKSEPSQNIYLIPIAVGETLVMLGLIAMNYCFRFDPSARDASSLADYDNFNHYQYPLLWLPYYNYSLSHEDNQNANISGGTFSISFGMPEYAFFVTAFVFPFLVILSVELGKSFASSGKPRKIVDSLGVQFPSVARRIFRFLFVYLMFGSIAGMLTSFIKLLIAHPRPHFLMVCFQSYERSAEVGIANCFNENQDELREALRSFPSYHATIAVYGGAFLCLYMYYTMKFRGYYTINVMLSLPIFVMAAIGTLHRWATYHSTFRDIVWGGFIGLLMALYAVYGMLNRFKERSSATLPVLSANSAPEPFSLRPPSQTQLPPPPPPPPHVHLNPAFIDDEPIGNHFVRRGPPIAKDETSPQSGNASFPLFEDNSNAPTPTMLPRVTPQQPALGPGGRPTQAFNSSFGLDTDYRQQPAQQGRMTDYNKPRQRFSVPPPPQEPSVPRPASAYPRANHPPPPPRNRSRYEGASYF